MKFIVINVRKRKNIFSTGYAIPRYFIFFQHIICLDIYFIAFLCTHSWVCDNVPIMKCDNVPITYPLSHCAAFWLFVTGLLQILEGYFIDIFKSCYSYSNFDVLLLI